MAAIVETVVGDRRIQLGNEEFVRKMKFGAAWGKIRIGVRFAVNTTGGTFTNAIFQIGVCSGTTNTFNNGNTTGYWGCHYGQNYGTSGYTYNTTYYAVTANGAAVYRTGNTTTSSTLGWGGDSALLLINPWHSIWYADFEKPAASGGFGNQGITAWWQSTGSTPSGISYDHPQYEMWRGMESETAITGALNYNGKITTSYAGDFSVLDTLSILWNKTTPTIEISDIMVTRFY